MENCSVSIIIRTKNEEQWIGKCLDMVRKQTFHGYEVIAVDTGSTDATHTILASYPEVKVIDYRETYRPGKAINYGCEHAAGEYLVFLSAHCIPVNEFWLENLLKNMSNPLAAGVYGKQEPMDGTDPFDKRDLILTFGLERKVQWQDPFFHNANSAIKKELWLKLQFNNDVTNIEDRVWAANIQKLGYCIIYEPDARVFHHHGIHQKGCKIRLHGVNSIIDNMESYMVDVDYNGSPSQEFEKDSIIAVIPFAERITQNISPANMNKLFALTADNLVSNKYINDIVLLTDSEQLSEYVRKTYPFVRIPYLRKDNIQETLLSVLQDFIVSQDISNHTSILLAEIIFMVQNREGYFTKLCEEYMKTNHSSAVWLIKNYNTIFENLSGVFYRLNEDISKYKGFRVPFYETNNGLGKIISVKNIINGYYHDANTMLLQKNNNDVILQIDSDNSLTFIHQFNTAIGEPSNA